MSATLGAMVGAYLEGVGELKKAVAGMFDEHLTSRPIAGKWSTLEVVCHIADYEPILADRMKRIISEDRPLMVTSTPDQFAAGLRYHDRCVAEEMALIESTRKQMARILKGLPHEALNRQGVHHRKGLVTLENILAAAVGHIPHHVSFIQEKRKALGLPTG